MTPALPGEGGLHPDRPEFSETPERSWTTLPHLKVDVVKLQVWGPGLEARLEPLLLVVLDPPPPTSADLLPHLLAHSQRTGYPRREPWILCWLPFFISCSGRASVSNGGDRLQLCPKAGCCSHCPLLLQSQFFFLFTVSITDKYIYLHL